MSRPRSAGADEPTRPEGAGTGLRAAIGLLTSVGGAAPPSRHAVCWFGPVGALIGAGVGAAWWATTRAGAPLVAAAVALTVDLVATGLLHLDGLADSADGLLPPVPRDRRLAIMRQPDTGAFGVGAVAVALLLRWSALASVQPSWPLVAALWAQARGGMALTMAVVGPARPASLASPYAARRPGLIGAAAAASLALGLVVAGVGRRWAGGSTGPAPLPTVGPAAALAALAVAATGTAATVALAWRRVGGYTGDVLGAAGVVSETFGLVTAVLVAHARAG